MIANLRLAAIVTARGGSKGLPRKNVLPLGGRPLLTHTIAAAQGVKEIDEVVVTTDDAEIASAGRAVGAEIIDRPSELAADNSSSVSAVLHALDTLEAANRKPDVIVLLQPTSPLRNSAHIASAIRLYAEKGAGSVVSACEAEHHPYKTLIKAGTEWRPACDWASLEAPRQSLMPAFRANGAIYVVGADALRRHGLFFVQPLELMIMSREESIDIDSEDDLRAAERMLQQKEIRRA